MPLTLHCLNVCAYEWQEQLPGGIRSVRLGEIKNQFKIQHSPLSWWHDPMWQINYFRLHSPNQPTTVRRRSGWRQKRAPNVPSWQKCRSKFESEWNVEHEPSSQLGNSRLNENHKSVLDLYYNAEIGQGRTFFCWTFSKFKYSCLVDYKVFHPAILDACWMGEHGVSWKTSTRWNLNTVFMIWLKTLYLWLKTLYLSTRWLKKIQFYDIYGDG